MISASNSVKTSLSRKQGEKKFLGNYLGIVIQNDDPDCRGRVKIYVPHVAAFVYEGWTDVVKDKMFKFIGSNVDSDLSKIIEKLKHILPWSDCAAPLVGATGSGLYNAYSNKGSISDTSDFNTFTGNESVSTKYKLNSDGIGEKPAKIYEIEELKVADAFTSTSVSDSQLGQPRNINKFSRQYKPASYSNISKGTFSVPNVGSHVWVFFVEGDPMWPVYFAVSHGLEDWNAIYESSKDRPGYDYPGSYENRSKADGAEYNHNIETYRNKFVINQRGGVFEIINTSDKEVLKFTHFSGSFKEFNNDVNIEFATRNDQKLVQGDQFTTVNGKNNFFTGEDYESIVRGDVFRKIGTFREDLFIKWRDAMRRLSDIKQLFEIKRAANKGATVLQRQSPYQTKSGKSALCPLCSSSDRPRIWVTPSSVVSSLPVMRFTKGFKAASVLRGLAGGVKNPSLGTTGGGHSNFLGSGPCPVCAGTGISPSSYSGSWDVEEKDQLITDEFNNMLTDLTLLEKSMGTGGSEIINITKHKVETIGLVFNDFPSIRIDEAGKIVRSEMRVFRDGVVPSFVESPLIEYVHVDDLPGGTYALNVCNRFNVQTGAGGMYFKSAGPVDIGGSLINIAGEQINLGSGNEINISSKRINIVAEILSLRQKNNKQVLVEGNLGVSQNVIIGGGLHVEGELTVNHITAPLEIQETEEVILYGTPTAVQIGTCVVRNGSSRGSWPVYGYGAMVDCVVMNAHTHLFKNLPLNLVNTTGDVRVIGANCETPAAVPHAGIEHANKGKGLSKGGETL